MKKVIRELLKEELKEEFSDPSQVARELEFQDMLLSRLKREKENGL